MSEQKYGTSQYKHAEITEHIIQAFYTVYNTLGYGFLEKVYEKALALEIHKQDLEVNQQYPIQVFYDGQVVGEYFADLAVNDRVLVEIKALKNLAPEHDAQLLNYLKATNFEVGLLLNFGPKPEVKRRSFDNIRKQTKFSTLATE